MLAMIFYCIFLCIYSLVTSRPYTKVGYPEGSYAGRVCSIQVFVCGSQNRVGEVINALRGTNLTYTHIKIPDKTSDDKPNKTPDEMPDKTPDKTPDETPEKTTPDNDITPSSSPFQQACPFTISDFEDDDQHSIDRNETQDSNKTQDSNNTYPLFSTPDNSDADKTDLDATPEIHQLDDTQPQQTLQRTDTNNTDLDKTPEIHQPDDTLLQQTLLRDRVTLVQRRSRHMRIRRKNKRHMRILRRKQTTCTNTKT